MSSVDFHPSWLEHLHEEFPQPYMQQQRAFLVDEMKRGKQILPAPKFWFNALNSTPLEKVKVVILGQDPYPTPSHPHGLCFSVRPEVKPLPKSLVNIFTEMKEDIGVDNFHTGYLQPWAEQGVLLLNAVLTVEAGKPGSHQGKGWERFTDKVIEVINREKEGVVFVLWGSYAQKKGAIVDTSRHRVIKSPHPSPLSAYRGFFGSRPFSRINAWLEQRGETPVAWQL